MKLLMLPSDDHSKSVPPPAKSSLTPPTTGFNPLEVGVSLGNGKFDHQWLLETNLPWRGIYIYIYINFCDYCCYWYIYFSTELLAFSRDKLVKLVGNRFEFQPDAQLQDNEPDLVRDINSLLHHDNHQSP